MHRSYLKITVFILTLSGANAAALAHGEGEGNYQHPDCPVYEGCGDGMTGYVTGMDDHGCEILECVPDAQLQGARPISRGTPVTNDEAQPSIGGGNAGDTTKYKYDEPTSGAPAGSRLIDVQ